MRRLLASLLILLGLSLSCAAAVVVDSANCNAGTKQYKTSSTTQTLTGLTITAGSNLALAVFLDFDISTGTATPTIVSVTWSVGLTTLSLIAAPAPFAGNGPASQIWGAVGITAGTGTITMVTVNPQAVFMDACAFTGVNQTGGTTSFPGAQSGSAATTVTVSSATGDIVINQGGANGGGISGITGTTIYSDSVSGSIINSYANYDVGSASVTIGATSTSGFLAAVDVKAATGGGTVCQSRSLLGVGC